MKLTDQEHLNPLPLEALLVRTRVWRRDVDRRQGLLPAAELQSRIAWIHARLDQGSGARLSPYFDYLACVWLCRMLRYPLAGETIPVSLLNPPALAPGITRLVTSPRPGGDLVADLEKLLLPDTPWIAGVQDAWSGRGPGGVEEHLMTGVLQEGLRSSWRPVRALMERLVLIRSLITVIRYWRWQVTLPPELPLLSTEDREKLIRCWSTGERSRLVRFVREKTGDQIQVDTPLLTEQQMLGGVTRMLARFGRDLLSPAVVLDYLWRLQRAIARRVLMDAQSPDQGRLLEEGGAW